jgi:hypothetical protein
MAARKRSCATAGCSKPGRYLGRVWLGRDDDGKEQWDYLGYFCTKWERTAAQEARKRKLAEQVKVAALPLADRITCAEYADECVARMESGELRRNDHRRYKSSSIDTTRSQLKHFKRECGDRPLSWLATDEAVYHANRWAPTIPAGCMQATSVLANRAVAERLIPSSCFKGLGRRGKGRSQQDPPTPQQIAALLEACAVLGEHADRMRAQFKFAAHTLTRPGEQYALAWTRVNLTDDEVLVSERLYRGQLDLPKSNVERVIALTPPAREALLSLPEREGFVFRNKSGDQLTQPTLTGYWALVCASAGLSFDYYHATKHYGVWYMKTQLGLANSDIAEQAGWKESTVNDMIATYAHTNVGALDRIKAAYTAKVVALRPVVDVPPAASVS